MLTVNLEQGTKEWLEYRNTRIGATDFAVIAACNGLSTNLFNKSINQLIKDKINPLKFKPNKYFEMGHKFEHEFLSKLNCIDLNRGEIIQFENNDRIYASLDARDNFLNQIIEIKTTSKPIDSFDLLMQYYQYQVLHQCYCAGAEIGKIYIGFLDDNGNVISTKEHLVKPEKLLNKSKWLSMCEEFINNLDSENSAPDEILWLWNEYDELDKKIKSLQQYKEDLKQDIILSCKGNASYKQFFLKEQKRSSIKYADYIKDNNIEIPDQYKSISKLYILKGNKND